MRTWVWASLLCGILSACGGGSSATGDAGHDGAADFDAPPTFAERLPIAFAQDPTNIMTNPKGLAITFDGDPNQADADKFFGQYGASPAWAAQTAEYGIGTLTASATVAHMAGPVPTSISINTLLATLTANTEGVSPLWGPADRNTLYAFFLPQGMDLTDAFGSPCVDFDGFHSTQLVGNTPEAYAIIAPCANEATQEGITPLNDMMITAGHETVEAATDPRILPEAKLGWHEVDAAHSAFEYITEGELADLCEFASTQDWVAPPGMDYSIQRTWSNAAARAGHDPCVGEGSSSYYQTIPDDPDVGEVNYEGAPQPAGGTKVAVGATGMLNLQVYSDTPGAGPFTVELFDNDGIDRTTGADKAVLTFVQPTGTYMPGDRLSVPVTVKRNDPLVTGGAAYIIRTTPVPATAGPATFWYAWVLQ